MVLFILGSQEHGLHQPGNDCCNGPMFNIASKYQQDCHQHSFISVCIHVRLRLQRSCHACGPACLQAAGRGVRRLALSLLDLGWSHATCPPHASSPILCACPSSLCLRGCSSFTTVCHALGMRKASSARCCRTVACAAAWKLLWACRDWCQHC